MTVKELRGRLCWANDDIPVKLLYNGGELQPETLDIDKVIRVETLKEDEIIGETVMLVFGGGK